MDRAFVDTDIILDLLAERNPFYKSAAILFSKADRGDITLCVSTLSFANTHFLLRKKFSERESRKILMGFKTLVHILATTDKVIDRALASGFSDFEDAVQYYTASENNVNLLLTRNLKDYKLAKIPVMTAEAYIKTIGS
ncbi:MAG: PIN domain-containing protein [Flammeovirgaceae bacterium]|nr:MAG: PIN domain-containing protein [Flammeovirgaceae bacterium]